MYMYTLFTPSKDYQKICALSLYMYTLLVLTSKALDFHLKDSRMATSLTWLARGKMKFMMES